MLSGFCSPPPISCLLRKVFLKLRPFPGHACGSPQLPVWSSCLSAQPPLLSPPSPTPEATCGSALAHETKSEALCRASRVSGIFPYNLVHSSHPPPSWKIVAPNFPGQPYFLGILSFKNPQPVNYVTKCDLIFYFY